MSKEGKGQKYNVNERRSNQSTSKASFMKNETKDKLEKAETQQKERINSKEIPQDDSIRTNHHEKNSMNFKVTGKHQKKNNSKKIFKRTYQKTLSKTKSDDLLNVLNDESFEFEDIINNSRVVELVQDLVNSFTSNSTLPEKDLLALKESLFERTCYTFLNLLNNCVEKTYKRVLNSDFIQELKKETVKKDASCQTLFIQFSEGRKEGSQIQESIYVFP